MTDTHVTAPTQFVEVDGVRYAYRRYGAESGTPLLFFQHFRGGLDNWDPLVTDGLAQGRSVILFNYRSEEHTSELQSLMRISYAVFCLTKNTESRRGQEHSSSKVIY